MSVLLAAAVGGTYLVTPEIFSAAQTETVAVTDAKAPASTKKKAKKKAKKKGSAFDGVQLVTSTDWADATAKRDALSAQIISGMGDATASDAQKFVKSEANRTLLAQWVVAQAEVEAMAEAEKRAADAAANLKKLQDELAQKKADIPEGVKPTARQAWDIKQLENKIKRAEVVVNTPQTMAARAASCVRIFFIIVFTEG